MTKEIMKQALEALRMPCEFWNKTQFIKVTEAIKVLEEALKQEQDEPVAWWNKAKDTASTDPIHRNNSDCQPLYATTQQRKPLTDEQIDTILIGLICQHKSGAITIARAIEAAHGIKE